VTYRDISGGSSCRGVTEFNGHGGAER